MDKNMSTQILDLHKAGEIDINIAKKLRIPLIAVRMVIKIESQKAK